MRKHTFAIVAGLSLAALSASATIVVDVDNSSFELSGSTTTFEATEGGGGLPNVSGRYLSVTSDGTDRIAQLGKVEGKVDFYLHWNNIADSGLDATTYKYAQIDYSLGSDFVSGTHKFRLGDTVSVTGTAGANDPFTNPELLNTASAMSAGAHSFIVDLTASVSYAGAWKYLRWNFYNHAGNQEKFITMDKITFATDISELSIGVIPEPSALATLLGLGALVGLANRRRR